MKGSLSFDKYYVNNSRRTVEYINFNKYTNKIIIQNLNKKEFVEKYNYMFNILEHIRFPIITSFIKFKKYGCFCYEIYKFNIPEDVYENLICDIAEYIEEKTVYKYNKYNIVDIYDNIYSYLIYEDECRKEINIELNDIFKSNNFYTCLNDDKSKDEKDDEKKDDKNEDKKYNKDELSDEDEQDDEDPDEEQDEEIDLSNNEDPDEEQNEEIDLSDDEDPDEEQDEEIDLSNNEDPDEEQDDEDPDEDQDEENDLSDNEDPDEEQNEEIDLSDEENQDEEIDLSDEDEQDENNVSNTIQDQDNQSDDENVSNPDQEKDCLSDDTYQDRDIQSDDKSNDINQNSKIVEISLNNCHNITFNLQNMKIIVKK